MLEANAPAVPEFRAARRLHRVEHVRGGLEPGDVEQKAQPLRSPMAAGIPVALGSDGPMNPYLNIMLAATHPNRPIGTTPGSNRSRVIASDVAYTLTAAYAEFAEKEKGSLEPGKLADLAVLSQDIFSAPLSDLPKTESVLTLVGRKTVCDTGALKAQ